MLHPLIKVVELGVIQGKGYIAQGLIRQGEVISRLDGAYTLYAISEVQTWDAAAIDELLHYGYQCSATEIVQEHGDEKYMNHSCNPNTWWADDHTMIARRDIQAGEEITYDYATTEVTLDFTMQCYCGSSLCRGVVTNKDHVDPQWQARFGDHLPTHTKQAIAHARQKLDTP
jgi:hypothetical protein